MISDNDAERFSLNIKLENDRTVFLGKSNENAYIELEPALGLTDTILRPLERLEDDSVLWSF